MSDREDEIRNATQDMNSMLRRIADSKPGKMTSGMEAQYGQAYQRLVRLGAKQQIKMKYRGAR